MRHLVDLAFLERGRRPLPGLCEFQKCFGGNIQITQLAAQTHPGACRVEGAVFMLFHTKLNLSCFVSEDLSLFSYL